MLGDRRHRTGLHMQLALLLPEHDEDHHHVFGCGGAGLLCRDSPAQFVGE
ncbi:hypothetical protein GBAR_LOCUS19959 [Geodia barretti]|uniref:Uncharacterized protein n=1 Tax=Geodia barretti TaxID=519541 RepID=A0AA35WVQ7_GEOBA|nr:hypothetical protein GBAR_LOCUS19959 [Geodia barretti]